MAKWSLVCFTYMFLVTIFDDTFALVQGNNPPVIQASSNKYVIIGQSLPQRSALQNVQASDPENGTLFYSIIGVTYYQNGTAKSVTAFNWQWAIKTIPEVGFDACKTAESYAFPRNLFCMDPRNNTIKTTVKYDQLKKADFSLLAVTVLVVDNGIPQRNVTTKVYFRVKENCTAGATEYTNLVQKCQQSREIIKRGISLAGEISFQIIVPNNTKITRITIDFSKFAPFKFIEEVIRYEFRFEKQTKVLLRRLLVDTAREPKLEMYLWSPIDIVGTTGNISLNLRVMSEKGTSLLGGTSGIELYLLDRSKNYCLDSNCVSLYSVLTSVLTADGRPECARKDGYTTIAKYGSCKANQVVNTAPTWVNSKSNYVTVRRDVLAGTTVFKILATDSKNQSLTYSLTSATYFQSEASQPVKLPLSSWPVTATGNILTSSTFASLQPGYKSIFILNIMIADNGTPRLNTTGLVFVRIVDDCPVIYDASKQCMPGGSNFTSSNVIAVDRFSFNAPYFRLHKMMIDFRGFMPFDSGNEYITIRFSSSVAGVVTFQRRILQDKTRQPQWLIDIDPSVNFNSSFLVFIEFGKTKLRTLQVIPKSVTPIILFGIPNGDFCTGSYESCRVFYSRTRANLRKTSQLECLSKDTSYLLDGMFQKCGIIFSPAKLSVFNVDWPSGRRIYQVKAFANDPLIFSITTVIARFDGIAKDSTARNASWRLKTTAEAANDCKIAVNYAYPRNLFCIDSYGVIKTTSKFRNVLKVFSLVSFEVVATNSADPKKYSTTRIHSTSEPNITHFHCAEVRGALSSFKRDCDNTKGSPIVLSRIANTNDSHFTAPSVRSLVTQIGVKLHVLRFANEGSTITYTFIRAGKPNATVKSFLIPGKTMRFKSPHTYNSSLYRQPLELASNERVTVKLSLDFTPSFQGNDIILYTIPLKDYCLSDCVSKYTKIVNSVPTWYPNFPCGYSNEESYNAKYGYCLGNNPPKIVSPNTFTPDAASAKSGSIVGRIVATDSENTKLVYGFQWIHSFLTQRNMTVKPLSNPPCVNTGKDLSPLNYICINKDTGDINITSQYVQQIRDVLTVRVYAVDSGKPRRITSQTITISFKDQCEKAAKTYQNLFKNCMGAALNNTNALSTKSFGKRVELNIPTKSPPDRVVLLSLNLNSQLFPRGTLHTIFTLKTLTSVEPEYVYGEQAQVLFNNSAHDSSQSTIVTLPVNLSIAQASRVVVSAVSLVKTVVLPATTTTTTTTLATKTAKALATTTIIKTPTVASTTTSGSNHSHVLTTAGPTMKSRTTRSLTNATTTTKASLFSTTTKRNNQTTAPPTLANTTTSKTNISVTNTPGPITDALTTLPPPIITTLDPNATTDPPRPLRKRRFLQREAFVQTMYITQNVSITVYGAGISLKVQKYTDFCGSTSCVTTYKTWVSETKKAGETKCGKDPFYAHNYFKVCLNPPTFKTEPVSIKAKLNQRVRLTCSYQNFTQIKSFQWLKDGRAYDPPKLQVLEGRFPRAVSPDSTKYLDVQGSDPEVQGYYTCMVKDALNNTVKSKESLVHFTDVSSTKMSVKIKRTFSNALKDKTSTEYKTLSQDVSKALSAKLDSLGMHKNRKIVINGFRAGSVIVDANVYFLNVNSSNRNSICSQLRNVSSTSAPSNLEIESVETTSFDCCYASQTGEANIKGIISWRTTIANFADTQYCPYEWFSLNGTASKFGNATRQCLPNFRNGAVWQNPNIDQCGYKSATTQVLEDIAKTNITDSNVQDVSTKLDTATSSPKDFTNRLDVKFASDAIENLVKSKKKLSTIAKDILNATSNMMDVNVTLIADSQLKYKSSSRILSSLENLANEIPIANNTPVVTVRRNVAFAVKPLKQTTEDIIITATRQTVTGFNFIDILSDKTAAPKRRRERSAEIKLSKAMVQKAESLKPGALNRVYSFVFENDRLFITSSSLNLTVAGGRERHNRSRVVDSRILSASFGGLKLMNLTSAEEMKGFFRPLSQRPGRIDCVFWDTLYQDGYGSWSSDGCRYDGMQDGMHRCRCDHLTNFAILLDVTGKGTPKGAALALSIVTYIGCGVSLLSLLIILLTFVIFKKLREKRPPRILICLCFALIATLIIFLAGISAKDLKSCQAVAILIHYFVLLSFMWMAVEGFNLYLSFVKIMDTDITHFILKSSVVAWGIPAVIVAITAGVTKLEAYGKKNGDEWICMVTGTAFYAGYLTPILIIVVANLIVMGFVIRSLKKSAQVSKDRKMNGLTMARIVAACSVLMGTTWIIGLFAVDVLTLPVQIAFCVLNSLQGFFIFLFYGVRNSDVRKQWRSMCGWRSSEDSRSSSAPDYSRKRHNNTDSIDSNKRMTVRNGKYDLPMSNFGSGTLTTSVSDILPTERSTKLTSFVAQPSTKKGDFPESEKNGSQTSSKDMEMSFQLQPGEAGKEKGTKLGQPGSSTGTIGSHVIEGFRGSQSMDMTFGMEPIDINIEIKIPK